jgi:hypothetical protein
MAGRPKLEERYLKYRHYYVGIDVAGFGGYGEAVYAPLLPLFDQWYRRRSLYDVPPNITFLEDRLFLANHSDYREERGGAVSFHIKVLALSMVGLIMNHRKDSISQSLFQCIISDVSQQTKSYDYSECVCFSITVRMFIEMLKEEFAHFGSQVSHLSIADFANDETLNPKPQPVIHVL